MIQFVHWPSDLRPCIGRDQGQLQVRRTLLRTACHQAIQHHDGLTLGGLRPGKGMEGTKEVWRRSIGVVWRHRQEEMPELACQRTLVSAGHGKRNRVDPLVTDWMTPGAFGEELRSSELNVVGVPEAQGHSGLDRCAGRHPLRSGFSRARHGEAGRPRAGRR